MKNLTALALAFVLVGVLLYAGINGVMRDHSYGSFFIFLGLCTATGLSLDVSKLVKERVRKANARKLGR
jgi:hypothetical protein